MTIEDKPLVVGIGAQKAGTSWLSIYFQRHPQFFLPKIKELHVFDVIFRSDVNSFNQKRHIKLLVRYLEDFLRHGNGSYRPDGATRAAVLSELERLAAQLDDSRYINFFRHRMNDERAFGEITPAYSLLDTDAFGHIAGMHPDARFLFLMRDPVDRLWSQLRFERTWRTDLDILGDFANCLADPHYADRSRYDKTISALESAVSRDRIHYEFYEHLFSEEALIRISEFCGIEFSKKAAPAYDNKVLKSPALDYPPRLRRQAFEAFRDVYVFCRERFGNALPEAWQRTMAEYDDEGK